jgi:hypothetical protein
MSGYLNQKNNVHKVHGTLSNFFAQIYRYVGYGLLTAGLVSYTASLSVDVMDVLLRLHILLALGSIGVCMILPSAVYSSGLGRANALFFGFSALEGLLLAPIFLLYTQQSIATIFMISAAVFLASAQYGLTTGEDLTKAGVVARCVMLGIFVVTLIHSLLWMFAIHSSKLQYIISLAVAAISPVLIASTSQDLAMLHQQHGDDHRVVVLGALTLFIQFINLFVSLLRLLGDRRKD